MNQINNQLAHCISTQCEKYDTCYRAQSKNNSDVDYIRVDEGECVYYIESIIEKVEEIMEGEDDGNEINI